LTSILPVQFFFLCFRHVAAPAFVAAAAKRKQAQEASEAEAAAAEAAANRKKAEEEAAAAEAKKRKEEAEAQAAIAIARAKKEQIELDAEASAAAAAALRKQAEDEAAASEAVRRKQEVESAAAEAEAAAKKKSAAKQGTGAKTHQGKMKCACAHNLGEVTFPLDKTFIHVNGGCLWTCCGLNWSDRRCPGQMLSVGDKVKLTKKYAKHGDAADGPLKPGADSLYTS